MSTTESGEVVERTIDGVGLLRFENFGPGEWLTKAGQPAKIARRRYLLNGEALDSVSAITDTIDKSGGLVPWAEDCGAQGAAEAIRKGKLDRDLEGKAIVERVRELGLGREGIVSEAQERGNAVHAALHALAITGTAPMLADFPQAWHNWVKGAVRAWLKLDPEPIDAEFMVCHPQMGYAGRPDLLCNVKGQRTLLDYKTGKGKVYEQAHYQTRGYAEAMPQSGIEPPESIIIIGIGDDAHPYFVDCEATSDDWHALVQVYRSRKRVNAAIAAARKAVKA